MIKLIAFLTLAGVISGLVNFFYSYLSLPTKSKDETKSLTEEENPWALPKRTWQLALTGYIIIGIAGAFLTPLIHAVVGLKGVDNALEKTLLVTFGYGLVFGFCTNQILSSIANSILSKIEKMFAEKQKNESFRKQFTFQQEVLKTGDSEVCPNPGGWAKAPGYDSKPLTTMAWANDLTKDKFGCTRDAGNKFHGGIDIGAEEDTECYALAAGTITDIGFGAELGKYIALQFEKDGILYGAGYCHLNEINVKKNEKVTAGQVIGKTGITGNVGGDKAHLHLEIHKKKWLTYSSIEDRSKASLDPNHYV